MSRACSLGLAFVVLLASVAAVRGEDAKKPRTDLYGDPLPPGALMRLGTVRLRHANSEMTFSADGKRVISCDGCGEFASGTWPRGDAWQQNGSLGSPCGINSLAVSWPCRRTAPRRWDGVQGTMRSVSPRRARVKKGDE